MKCRIKRSIVFLAIALSFLLMPVCAHSGRTDASGGHYDRSTGTYHYHHGYPAHSHYDMNHDGVIDCPYKFQDKTDQSSGNNAADSNNESSFGSGALVTTAAATATAGFWAARKLFSKK